MDGNGALFGTLQGNTREVLHKFTVDLPKKHGEAHFSNSNLLCQRKILKKWGISYFKKLPTNIFFLLVSILLEKKAKKIVKLEKGVGRLEKNEKRNKTLLKAVPD